MMVPGRESLGRMPAGPLEHPVPEFRELECSDSADPDIECQVFERLDG